MVKFFVMDSFDLSGGNSGFADVSEAAPGDTGDPEGVASLTKVSFTRKRPLTPPEGPLKPLKAPNDPSN